MFVDPACLSLAEVVVGSTAGDLWVQLTEPSLYSHFSQRSKAYSLPPPEPRAPGLVKHWGMRGGPCAEQAVLCGALQIQAALVLPGVCPPLELFFKSAQGPGQVAREDSLSRLKWESWALVGPLQATASDRRWERGALSPKQGPSALASSTSAPSGWWGEPSGGEAALVG